MTRIDHAAFETEAPRGTAAFHERVLGARIVAAEGHPVMAYVGATGFAFHELGGPGPHTAVRVSEDEREQIRRRLDAAGSPGANATTALRSGSSSRTRTVACSRRSRTAAATILAAPGG